MEPAKRTVPKCYGYIAAVAAALGLAAMIGLCIWDLNRVRWQTLREHNRLTRFLSCAPERPLPREELFVLAMRDYWWHEVNDLWKNDKAMNEEYPQRDGGISVAHRECDLIRNKWGKPVRIGSDSCYPWKITAYTTLEEVRQRLKEPNTFRRKLAAGTRGGWSWRYDALVRDDLHGEVYYPNSGTLYTTAHYNTETDFAVLHKSPPYISWYPKDCCRLLDYAEAVAELGEEAWRLPPRSDLLPESVRREDLYFLRVKLYNLDNTLGTASGGVFEFYHRVMEADALTPIVFYYIVSPCGTLYLNFK